MAAWDRLIRYLQGNSIGLCRGDQETRFPGALSPFRCRLVWIRRRILRQDERIQNVDNLRSASKNLAQLFSRR